MATIKDPIKLLFRERKGGRKAIFLNIYYKGGRRKQESLNLYIEPELTRADKVRNKEILALAEEIRAQRLIEYRNARYNVNAPALTSPYLTDYYEACMRRRNKEKAAGTMIVWQTSYNHLCEYLNHSRMTLEDIDKEFVEDYLASLEEKVSTNTALLYISKLNAVLRQAVKDQYISRNVIELVELPKSKATIRESLTIDELRKVAAAQCKNQIAKRAFLFSCLTGLRKSDILNLRWGDVRDGEPIRIIFKQQKTSSLQYLDISPQATALLGTRKKDNDFVFAVTKTQCNYSVMQLMKSAGINRKITFHCARHTFAVLMLELDVDIFTVQNLLGHKDIKTTMVYAKMRDKRKQEAVLKIPQI